MSEETCALKCLYPSAMYVQLYRLRRVLPAEGNKKKKKHWFPHRLLRVITPQIIIDYATTGDLINRTQQETFGHEKHIHLAWLRLSSLPSIQDL